MSPTNSKDRQLKHSLTNSYGNHPDARATPSRLQRDLVSTADQKKKYTTFVIVEV